MNDDKRDTLPSPPHRDAIPPAAGESEVASKVDEELDDTQPGGSGDYYDDPVSCPRCDGCSVCGGTGMCSRARAEHEKRRRKR